MSTLKHRRNIYIACEELNFIWCEDEVIEFTEMWNAGYGVPYIAKYFGRKPDDVTLLIFDLSRLREIKPRRGGLHGCEGKEQR